MNPRLIAALLLLAFFFFANQVWRHWQTLREAPAPSERRFNHPAARLRRTLAELFGQAKIRQYPLSGLAHLLVFLGFLVLGLRSVILLGRGFDPSFNAWLFVPGSFVGNTYARLKDLFVALTLVSTLIFGYLRLVQRPARLTLNAEGLVIVGLIGTMMLADLCYDGSCLTLLLTESAKAEELLAPFAPLDDRASVLSAHPIGAAVSILLRRSGAGEALLVGLAHAGYFIHILLVCAFLVFIPRSKHLHILTAPFNLYTSRLGARGKLPALATGAEDLMARVEAAAELPDEFDAPIGIAKVEHLTWKDRLDLLSCTECGRCTDHCPAARSGLALRPKALTLGLRAALYGAQRRAVAARRSSHSQQPKDPKGIAPDDVQLRPALVPHVISREAVWACTTCGACEQECPVGVTFVDKIVQMRRHLVTMRGELPGGLGRPFEALSTNYNPWSVSPLDRLRWAAGLQVPLITDTTNAEVLLWVGCAPAYDVRAQRVARSVAMLLTQARVRFAVLGAEERCTGDAARRSGNEMLFLELAEANITTLDRYRAAGGFRRIVTLCPHCYNTLNHEYPDLGGRYNVSPHPTYLLELVEAGRLVPTRPIAQRLSFHDPCYLTRLSGLGADPRRVLQRIPGVELLEVRGAWGARAECCGGGGAQSWLDQRGPSHTNERRAAQLAATGATTVVSACPFCIGMLSDGMASISEDAPAVRDLAELLFESCCPPHQSNAIRGEEKATPRQQPSEASGKPAQDYQSAKGSSLQGLPRQPTMSRS